MTKATLKKILSWKMHLKHFFYLWRNRLIQLLVNIRSSHGHIFFQKSKILLTFTHLSGMECNGGLFALHPSLDPPNSGKDGTEWETKYLLWMSNNEHLLTGPKENCEFWFPETRCRFQRGRRGSRRNLITCKSKLHDATYKCQYAWVNYLIAKVHQCTCTTEGEHRP